MERLLPDSPSLIPPLHSIDPSVPSVIPAPAVSKENYYTDKRDLLSVPSEIPAPVGASNPSALCLLIA